MTWIMFFKAIIATMAVCGYVYSLESHYRITKLEKEIKELKKKN